MTAGDDVGGGAGDDTPHAHRTDEVERLAGAWREARHVVVLTGAGASAESGVPTFRDALTGLWAKFDPAQLATPEAFAADPALVSRWYDERRRRVLECEPNAGHRALVRLARLAADSGRRLTLITQNVDRLHQRAGSQDVIELHGTLLVWRCTRTGREVEPGPEPFARHPVKTDAGGLLRPGVVWFGEMLPEEALRRAAEAAGSCDLFVSVGTSAVVYPAAGLAHEALRRGAIVAEINADATPLSGMARWTIRGRSGEVLPEIARLLGCGADGE